MKENIRLVWRKIDELIPYEHNAKLHPQEQIDKLVGSFDEFGRIVPAGIDAAGNLIYGHGRILAARQRGDTDFPCIEIDGLTETQRRAFVHADNLLSQSGTDEEILRAEMQALQAAGFDVSITGFDPAGLKIGTEAELGKVVEDDYDKEPPDEPKSKLGDIYQLGRHRLMCGDSTDRVTIEKLMDGAKADMVFTDPPYGVAYTGGMRIEEGRIRSNGKETIKNDALDYENLYSFLYDAFLNMQIHTKDRAALYVFYAHSRSREFLNAFHDAGLKQRSILIWHKIGGGFGDFMAQYMNAYEPCIYGSNGEAVNWYGATNEKTVWDFDKEKKCDLHPTMKPIKLCERAITNSSKSEDIVLDIFGGSGSTLIACEQLNRKCYMCELDPHYCDVIIDRWEKFAGKKAVLLDG